MGNTKYIPSPLFQKERDCPKAPYKTLLDNHASGVNQPSSNNICITTLTDTKNADIWQRLTRWRNFDSLLEITWENKKQYTEMHGYRLFDESHILDTSRPPSWSKVKATQRLLKEEQCEWVFWMDADTVIMNPNKRLEFESFLPLEHDFVLTGSNGTVFNANAGVWAIKNSPWSLNFLERWYNLKEFVRPKGFSQSGDNHALNHLLRSIGAAKDWAREFADHVILGVPCAFNANPVFYIGGEPTLRKGLLGKRYDKHEEEELVNSLSYYHKGDFIAHIGGYDNKLELSKMLLGYAAGRIDSMSSTEE